MHTTLAARTDFSIGESILSVEKLIDEAKNACETVVGITDTMSVTALIDFTTRAKKAGLRPIVGVRLRLTDDPTWRPAAGQKKKDMPREYFLTVYPLTETGMKAIFRLLTLASSEARFYYVPKLGFEDLDAELLKLGRDDMAIVIGDERSILEHPNLLHFAEFYQSVCDHVYAALVPINTPYFGRLNEISYDLVQRGLAKPLTIRPALYPKDQADSQEIMTAITENQKITDGWFRSRFNRDMHVMPKDDFAGEMQKAVIHLRKRLGSSLVPVAQVFKKGFENVETLANKISYEWSKQPVSLPEMAPDEFQAVVDACKAGWAPRFKRPVFGHQPTDTELQEVYKPRLAYELSVLKKLGFSGYFLLVQDIVTFAKSNGILVGPGRGSVGGSLVAYLMGITECDPIRFGLLFERFINPDRIDLPDADLDFMGERRHEVVEYLIKKYGQEKVAGVSNFGTLAAASAMRDVGRVTGIPERDYSVSKMAPKAHGANVPLTDCAAQVSEIAAFSRLHPAFWQVMLNLEGTIRNMAQHAAGVVVSRVDMVERGVVENRKGGNVVCWDKRQVEEMGLVKVDILGLKTLDIMDLALRYIEERHGVRPDISLIPLDDPKVLTRFAYGKTTGIFQFESGGMRRLLKELGHDGTITFDDITAATALYRPGPMESGMMDSFYLRKQGHETVEYDHPLMEPVLRNTFGVIVYQEQVMQISRVIAGYNGADADKLRKIMGKKLPAEMAKERDKFVKGCVDTIACAEAWAGALFDKIEGFAGYGFNKSHSVEYTLISYQSMWLKVNYPVEFYAAALTLMDEDKLPALLRDAKAEGISVDMPDINESTNRFEIVTNTRLVMPFQAIKGISSNTTEAIIAARATGKFTDMADFLTRVEKRRCNVRHQDSLNKVGAFACIEPLQVASNHPSRVRDQIDLLPGLVSANVPIAHDMHCDKLTREAIGQVVDDYRMKYGPGSGSTEGTPIKPSFGKAARIMIISDAPGGEEDAMGVMGVSRSNQAVFDAMMEVGLELKDVYWTALVKRPKRGSQITSEEIQLYKDYLDREIKILHPSVIVLMGSQTVRHFIPGWKGKCSEVAGKVMYFNDLDANVVIGFSPGEIYHDPEKQNAMNDVFIAVSTLLT